jgi:hypothetical protein
MTRNARWCHRILNIPKIFKLQENKFYNNYRHGRKKGRTDQVIVIGLLRPLRMF